MQIVSFIEVDFYNLPDQLVDWTAFRDCTLLPFDWFSSTTKYTGF
jgi:hypothetical protein